MLLRIRLTAFLAGFGLAGGLALYQIRQDVQNSHDFLAAQVRLVSSGVLVERAACRRVQICVLCAITPHCIF